jgi:hypothetical protein
MARGKQSEQHEPSKASLREDITALEYLRKANKYKAEGRDYLAHLGMALVHLRKARDLTSYGTSGADTLIRAIQRHIRECEQEI